MHVYVNPAHRTRRPLRWRRSRRIAAVVLAVIIFFVLNCVVHPW